LLHLHKTTQSFSFRDAARQIWGFWILGFSIEFGHILGHFQASITATNSFGGGLNPEDPLNTSMLSSVFMAFDIQICCHGDFETLGLSEDSLLKIL